MSGSLIRDSRDQSSPVHRAPAVNKSSDIHRQCSSSTPLHKFVEAKCKINETFQSIENYISETISFLNAIPVENALENESNIIDELGKYNESIKAIKSVLARDKMKVVFFGRTSNGKSTVVNAMLHAKVLPSGIGHTTRCFLQVEGSPSGEKFILTEGSDEQKSLQSIDSLSNALCGKDMGEDALVRVMWPRTDSRLLTNEVILLDSPGVDLSPQFDSWIDKHCLDADVFVLVCNAESTLTQTEKNFFHRVKAKLSKPNLFILNNRWDASAAEPEFMDQVKEQHMQQFLRFFVEELGVGSIEEASNRVFFVSAREMLQYRLRNRGIALSPMSLLAEGYEARMIEFEEFERKFELCISQSAIETKFESHIKNGEFIMDSVYTMLDKSYSDVLEKKNNICQDLETKSNMLNESRKLCSLFISNAVEELDKLSSLVQFQVSNEFADEIRRLENVVDVFQKPFTDDAAYLDTYKQELINHIGGIVTNDLQIRLTGGLLKSIIDRERAMIFEATKILPPQYEIKTLSVLQYRQPFRFSFAIHFPSLMSDFREDLQFRFSLAPLQLLRHFTKSKSHPTFNDHASHAEPKNDLFGSSSLIPRSVGQSECDPVQYDLRSNEDGTVVPAVVYSSAAYIANGGVGLMLIGGLVFRAIGWRILLTGASVCGLFYLYERLNWNNRTKERALKRQVRLHLSAKLHQMSQSVTISCDDQVKKEVSEIMGRLRTIMNEAQDELENEVAKCGKEAQEYEKLAKQFDKVKKRGIVLTSQLVDFLNEQMYQPAPH